MEGKKVNGRITLTIHTKEEEVVMCAGMPLAAHCVQEWDAENFGDQHEWLRTNEDILIKVIKSLKLTKEEATAALSKAFSTFNPTRSNHV